MSKAETTAGGPANAEEPKAAPHAWGEKPRGNWLARASEALDRGLMNAFEWLTTKIVGAPWWSIAAVVLLSVVLAQGFWVYDEELEAEKQFTPQDTLAFERKEWVMQRFGPSHRQITAFFMAPTPAAGGALGKEALLYMLAYHTWVATEAHAALGGERYDYNYSCARYSPRDSCRAAGSVLQLWGFNETALREDADPIATINRGGAWRAASPSGPDLPYFLHGIVYNGTGHIVGATGARMEFTIRYPRRKVAGKGDVNPEIDAFQLAVSDGTYDRSWGEPANVAMDAYVFNEADRVREERKAVDQDTSTLIIGYLLLIAFAMCMLSKNRVRYSHGALAFCTVFSVAMSTLSAYGLCWFLGIPFNMVVQVLILLLLGLGVDDAFIIMYSWWDNAHVPDMKERMVMTMRHAGPAILLTSVTDLVAFLVGSSTELPALRDFCFYATFGILFDFSYQITFFLACAFLASKRQEASKADCLCCVSVTDDTGCCVGAGKVGVDWTESDPGLFRDFFGAKLPRAVLSNVGRVLVLVCAAAFVAVGIYGCTEVNMNFDLEWFIPADSRLQDVFEVRDAFGGRFVPCHWWSGEMDYAHRQHDIAADIEILSTAAYAAPMSLAVWLFDFQSWVAQARPEHYLKNGTSPGIVDPAHFYRLLKVWADVETGPQASWHHIDNLRWKADGTGLVAVRYPFLVDDRPFADGSTAYEALLDFRAVGRRTATGIFPWAYYFIFFEGYGVYMKEMIRNISISAACVFALVAVTTANVALALALVINVALIDVCLVGWMPIIGVEVNSVSVICVVLAIGLVVDYSVHIAGEFVKVASDPTTTPDTHGFSHGQLRMAAALYKMAPGVGAGGLSTFLAVLPLAAAKSYIFSTFFRMFALIIGFGLFFGMAFLPVVLSMVNLPAHLGAPAVTDRPDFMPLKGFCLAARPAPAAVSPIAVKALPEKDGLDGLTSP